MRSTAPFGLGVALSGGGARGFAHAGALMALEHAGLRPDIIAGVSAGSVAAVMYAAGMRPMQIAEAFKGERFGSLTDLSAGRDGLFKLDPFRAFLRRTVSYRTIESLPMPTVICATDFDAGRPVAFTSGQLDQRVAASCCIPMVFRPIVIDGRRYVDGGLMRNLPAWAIRSRCRYLVGLDCSPLGPATDRSFVGNAMRTYKLAARANVAADLKLCDMVISADEIATVSVFDLDAIDSIVRAGYEAARVALDAAGFPPLGPGDRPPRF